MARLGARPADRCLALRHRSAPAGRGVGTRGSRALAGLGGRHRRRNQLTRSRPGNQRAGRRQLGCGAGTRSAQAAGRCAAKCHSEASRHRLGSADQHGSIRRPPSCARKNQPRNCGDVVHIAAHGEHPPTPHLRQARRQFPDPPDQNRRCTRHSRLTKERWPDPVRRAGSGRLQSGCARTAVGIWIPLSPAAPRRWR